MSQTYKPKNKKRMTTHGFLTRKRSNGGRNTLLRRRRFTQMVFSLPIKMQRIMCPQNLQS